MQSQNFADNAGEATDQSLSYKTTMSAVVRLIPRPPALVVRRKMNFSEPGLLYSSIALIRSSCAVPPSIRQYSGKSMKCRKKASRIKSLTVTPEQAIIFENIQNPTHLTEDENARSFLFHRSQKFIQDDHLSRVLDDMLISGIWGARLLYYIIYGEIANKQHDKKWLTAPSKRYGWHVTFLSYSAL